LKSLHPVDKKKRKISRETEENGNKRKLRVMGKAQENKEK